MNDRTNKTSICSIVFLDIIDYSKKPDSEQIEVKNQFNTLINTALKDIAQNDRIILDTGDGAAIAYHGSPEDALFMALNIRDGILKSNTLNTTPLFVRFGINLGPVRVVKDINDQPNIIGDGINVAQRIMSFAKPNQILVSRSYFEITSRLTQEISQMFDYSGVKHDKHVREHEVYSVRSQKDKTLVPGNQAEDQEAHLPSANKLTFFDKINGNYIAPAMFTLVALFAIAKLALAPTTPVAVVAKSSLAVGSAIAAAPDKAKVVAAIKPASDDVKPSQTTKKLPIEPSKTTTKAQSAKLEKKKQKKLTKKQDLAKMPPAFQLPHKDISHNPQVAENKVKHVEKSAEANEQSSWETHKQGSVRQCSQAEVAMGQCRQ